jgi:hypothetical protein
MLRVPSETHSFPEDPWRRAGGLFLRGRSPRGQTNGAVPRLTVCSAWSRTAVFSTPFGSCPTGMGSRNSLCWWPGPGKRQVHPSLTLM